MIASILYRVASVLTILFALGHQVGFRKTAPEWGAGSAVESMHATRFVVNGFSRSYWDFYTGFGFSVTAFLAFAAVLAWQLAVLSRAQPRLLSVVAWALVACFTTITLLIWRYFFVLPGVLSALITVCLFLAAWNRTMRPLGDSSQRT